MISALSPIQKNQLPDVVSVEFEPVMSTGSFECKSVASPSMAVTLQFRNSSGGTSIWGSNEIRKFVRGLQLSDPDDDLKKKVDHFLYLHEVWKQPRWLNTMLTQYCGLIFQTDSAEDTQGASGVGCVSPPRLPERDEQADT